MIKSIAVKSVRKAKSSELVKKAQSSTSLSLRKAQSKELVGTIGQVVKKKLAQSYANDGGVIEALANGAVDVIVVRSSDGTLSSTPWYGQNRKIQLNLHVQDWKRGWCICEQRACTSADDSLRLWEAQL